MNERQLYVAYTGEGPSDRIFLQDVIRNSLDYCTSKYGHGLVDILGVEWVKGIGDDFVSKQTDACRNAADMGAELIVIHADADDSSDSSAMKNKFAPLRESLAKQKEGVGRPVEIVPAVPVHEIEAWLLADKSLLKKQLDTGQSDADLGLDNSPENYTHPKEVIQKAIGVASAGKTKRRRNEIKMTDLYEPIGRNLSVVTLRSLPSFEKFLQALNEALVRLGVCSPK